MIIMVYAHWTDTQSLSYCVCMTAETTQGTNRIEVFQDNWDGNGNCRSFTYWANADTIGRKLDQIAQAYNFSQGRTRVELNGRDYTTQTAERKW